MTSETNGIGHIIHFIINSFLRVGIQLVLTLKTVELNMHFTCATEWGKN